MAFYRGFVLDDAYIIYRYSKHLIEGHGLTWNVGEKPVEGYTSFLWVVANILPLSIKADPAIFSKVVSAASALLAAFLIVRTAGRNGPGLAIALGAAICASPAYAFVSSFGMETSITVTLLCLVSYLSWRSLESPSKKMFLWLWAAAFFSMLSRPDSAGYVAGAALGILLVLSYRKDRDAIWNMALTSVPFFILGVIYMAWRLSYFGHLLPNTFNVKVGGTGFMNTMIKAYITGFITHAALPYAGLFAIIFYRYRGRELFMLSLPGTLGAGVFAFYLLNIIPVQGLLWRFIYPAYLPFILTTALVAGNGKKEGGPLVSSRLGAALLALFFIGWNLHILPQTLEAREMRTSEDRVLAGKALRGLPGIMFVSESGALPYFSEWKSEDPLGLTSYEIATQGLDKEHLAEWAPDLVMTVAINYVVPEKVSDNAPRSLKDVVAQNNYMAENGFVVVCAIKKHGNYRHFYFADTDSSLFDEIVKRLTEIEAVEYADLNAIYEEPRMPVYGN